MREMDKQGFKYGFNPRQPKNERATLITAGRPGMLPGMTPEDEDAVRERWASQPYANRPRRPKPGIDLPCEDDYGSEANAG